MIILDIASQQGLRTEYMCMALLYSIYLWNGTPTLKFFLLPRTPLEFSRLDFGIYYLGFENLTRQKAMR